MGFAVNMEDQDDAEQEQRLINEGLGHVSQSRDLVTDLMRCRVQNLEEEQPVSL